MPLDGGVFPMGFWLVIFPGSPNVGGRIRVAVVDSQGTTGAVCPHCRMPVPASMVNVPGWSRCPECGESVQVWAFAAAGRARVAEPGEPIAEGSGTAGCYFHARRRAIRSCERCGRFLCRLCDCEMAGQRLCPSCVDQMRARREVAVLETRRMCNDSICLSLALIPLILWPVTLLTAPATLALVGWSWRSPRSILPRTRWRYGVAAVLALLQIAGWILGIVALVKSGRWTPALP